MKKQPKPKPLEFLAKAQKDPDLGARLFAALEEGGRVTAEQVLQIASESGYSFTMEEFEEEVRRDMAIRFAAGEQGLADVVRPGRRRPPMSSCARGCLSWTKNWHPRERRE
ncbi:MAG TPA: Nif11-like leader peptide family natural product precursor [Thermoanaerobaculia bacterium]